MHEIPLHSIIPRYERLKSNVGRGPARVYLVGGAVRDFLLGRPSYDFDFIVFGDPEGFARAFSAKARGQAGGAGRP